MKAKTLFMITLIAVVLLSFSQSVKASDVNATSYTMTTGTTGNVLTWQVLDNLTSTVRNYTIYQDEIAVSNGTWTNLTDITLNIDGLALGTYNFTLIALDYINSTLQFSARGTIIVTVIPPPDFTATAGWVILIIVIGIGVITMFMLVRNSREHEEHERKRATHEHQRNRERSNNK